MGVGKELWEERNWVEDGEGRGCCRREVGGDKGVVGRWRA